MSKAASVLGALEQSLRSFAGGFSKRLGDTVCSVSSCHSRQTDDDQIRSVWSKLKSHWIITVNGKINRSKCKLVFPTDTLQQKIEITDLNHFFSCCKY